MRPLTRKTHPKVVIDKHCERTQPRTLRLKKRMKTEKTMGKRKPLILSPVMISSQLCEAISSPRQIWPIRILPGNSSVILSSEFSFVSGQTGPLEIHILPTSALLGHKDRALRRISNEEWTSMFEGINDLGHWHLEENVENGR